ncbi:MAG: F0F1 ATP synthase subunit B, partial [Salinisphaera sp.]|nr:F0F1 ATP synthase subunit B [Salinisphaera sp.]
MVGITGTLIVEIIIFLVTIWLLKRWLWGPLLGVMDARSKQIADGIAAGEKGQRKLLESERQAQEAIEEARQRATKVIDNANRRAQEVVDAARSEAEAERAREVQRAREPGRGRGAQARHRRA